MPFKKETEQFEIQHMNKQWTDTRRRGGGGQATSHTFS